MKSPLDELAGFLSRSAAAFEDRMLAFARALVEGKPDRRASWDRLAEVLGQTMALADLYGRRRVLLEVDSMPSGQFAGADPWPVTTFAATPLSPDLSFKEALGDLISREPRLAGNAELVAQLYQTRHAFALARSSELEITRRVQTALTGLMSDGITRPRAEQVIREIGGWTRAYADTVYRTNLNTAYTAGRFQQAADPDIADVAPAFERFSIRDSNVRPNHLAAHGLMAGTHDPIWDIAATPSGYGCRCNMRLVSKFELKRLGLLGTNGEILRRIPAGFENYYPDENFEGGRPDRRMYLGG